MIHSDNTSIPGGRAVCAVLWARPVTAVAETCMMVNQSPAQHSMSYALSRKERWPLIKHVQYGDYMTTREIP